MEYDFVIDDNDRLDRVQVKTTSFYRNNGYEVALRTSGGNRSGIGKIKYFDPDKYEWLYVLTIPGSDRFLIPSTEIEAKNSIMIGPSGKWDQFRVRYEN